MSSSKSPHMFTLPITLTPTHDADDKRRLTLTSSNPILIGRASKSGSKSLEAAPDNALFDCPVMSRQHAELKAHAWAGDGEQVVLMDKASMHGTFVNGDLVQKSKPFTLRSGDVIRFGDRVTRGSDTFDGVTVVFDAPQPLHQHSFPAFSPSSRGFVVPSGSDDESDYESDRDSAFDVGAKNPSSAQTTPDSHAKLGTLESPIDIESHRTGYFREIVDLDAAPAPRVVPTADTVIPDSLAPVSTRTDEKVAEAVSDVYSESKSDEDYDAEDYDCYDDDESIQYEIESENSDEAMTTADVDVEPQRDVSSQDEDDYETDDAEPPEIQPIRRFVAVDFETNAQPKSKKQIEPQAASQSSSHRQPYDPVRGSQPPTDRSSKDILADFDFDSFLTGCPPTVPIDTFTTRPYDSLKDPCFMTLSTSADPLNRSRWDVRPSERPTWLFDAEPTSTAIPSCTSKPTPSSCFMPTSCRSTFTVPAPAQCPTEANTFRQPPLTTPVPRAPAFLCHTPATVAEAEGIHPFSPAVGPTTRAPPPSGPTHYVVPSEVVSADRERQVKMSIPHIVVDEPSVVITTSKSRVAETSTSCAGTKRKAEETVATLLDENMIAKTESLSEVQAPSGCVQPPRKKLKARRTSKTPSIAREISKYAFGFAMGVTGTMAFFASPLGEIAAEWASAL